MRRIGYGYAVTALVFTALWFFIGLFVLWTPVPHALGIRGAMFVAWLLLFFAILGLSGVTLLIASLNGIFPPNVRAPRRAEALWANPSAHTTTTSARRRTTPGARPSGPGRG